MHADRLHLYSDPAFPFQIHPVKRLRLHLSFFNGARQFQKPIRQRGFAMVNMGDNTEVADRLVVFLIHVCYSIDGVFFVKEK